MGKTESVLQHFTEVISYRINPYFACYNLGLLKIVLSLKEIL